MKHLTDTLPLLFLAFFCFACTGKAAPPSVAVTIRSTGGGPEYPKLIVAAWPDGRIVWADNRKEGGSPFREARIDPVKVATLVAAMEERDVFDENQFRHSWFGPDSTYHSIWLSNGRKHTRIESWHELFERNPKLVVINGGVTGLDGRKREDAIAGDKSEFPAFRVLWMDLRISSSRLIPKEGKPLAEAPPLDLPHD